MIKLEAGKMKAWILADRTGYEEFSSLVFEDIRGKALCRSYRAKGNER